MGSEEASHSKLMETRATILEKAEENNSAAQKKQKTHYNRKHENLTVYKLRAKMLVKNILH